MLRTVALLCTLAFLASGCSALTGRPFAQWSGDAAMTARVKTRLVGAHPRALTHVNVDTYGGIVYLTGVLPHERAKARVEEAARSVEGVSRVVSNLAVGARGGDPGSSPAALPIAALERPVPAALAGIARLEGTRALDEGGRHVATVHTVPMAELAQAHATRFDASEPVVHVTVHAVDADAHVPLPHYLVVLWHVREAGR